MSSCEDIGKYVETLGALKKEFRRVHYHLKVLDPDNFDTSYPEYTTQLQKLSDQYKGANEKLSSLKYAEKLKRDEADHFKSHLEAQKLKREMEVLELQQQEKRTLCLSQRQICVEQLDHFIKSSVWDEIKDIRLIEQKISSVENCFEKFNTLRSNYLSILGKEECIRLGFDVRDAEWVNMAQEHLESGKGRLAYLITERELGAVQSAENEARERELAEEARLDAAECEEKAKIDNMLVCAESLVFEIKTRYDTLSKKCVVKVDELSDHEILDLKKREDGIHGELRELMDKISEFEKFVVPCGSTANDLRMRVVDMRQNCSEFAEQYFSDLSEAVTNRDISERKLKNAAGLIMNLTKFTGYSSEIDIYTFRSDFKKLVESES